MTRTTTVARVRPVFTITTVGSSLAPARDCKPVRPTTEHEHKVLLLPFRLVNTPRSRLPLLIAAGAGLDVAVLGSAGWALGRSEVGAAILTAIAVGGAVVLVLMLAARGRVEHCPGCPR